MLEHILRRMGFGASPDDLAYYADLSPMALVNTLLDFERVPDDVDAWIGHPDYAGVTTRGQFQPNTSSATRASAGCSGWSTRAGRSRRRWRSSGTTTSPRPTARWPARSDAVHATKMMDAQGVRGGRWRSAGR
jgi:hypothetical protein